MHPSLPSWHPAALWPKLWLPAWRFIYFVCAGCGCAHAPGHRPQRVHRAVTGACLCVCGGGGGGGAGPQAESTVSSEPGLIRHQLAWQDSQGKHTPLTSPIWRPWFSCMYRKDACVACAPHEGACAMLTYVLRCRMWSPRCAARAAGMQVEEADVARGRGAQRGGARPAAR